MASDKISGATGLATKMTGYIQSVVEWFVPYITLKNILIFGGLCFIIWYWMRSNEEKYNNHKARLPFK